LASQLARISAPTLVISGSADLATPVECQALIAAAVPSARHEIVAAAAHVAAVERPEPVNQLIEEHLS
jgi:pimeloyl-ACP methyl ester carboxylesterase